MLIRCPSPVGHWCGCARVWMRIPGSGAGGTGRGWGTECTGACRDAPPSPPSSHHATGWAAMVARTSRGGPCPLQPLPQVSHRHASAQQHSRQAAAWDRMGSAWMGCPQAHDVGSAWEWGCCVCPLAAPFASAEAKGGQECRLRGWTHGMAVASATVCA